MKLSFPKEIVFKYEKKVVYISLVLHIVASQILLPYFGKLEIYPIFQWNLFSNCDPIRDIPEVEIYFNKKKLTNRKLPRFLQWKIFFLMRSQLRNKNQNVSDKTYTIVLDEIYKFIKQPFQYKIFKSKVNLIRYAKHKEIEREFLLKEGLWEVSK